MPRMHTPAIISEPPDYDAVVVGASLAGCTTALLLARHGLRVALVEQRADPAAFKRVCTHYIQSSAVGVLDRLGLMAAIMAAGGMRSRTRVLTRWGWMQPPPDTRVPANVNLRREKLDPLIRGAAADQKGIELILGHTVERVIEAGGAVRGVEAVAPDGARRRLTGTLTVGADGRHSSVAKLAGVRTRSKDIGRFGYAGYFEGPPIATAPDCTMWLLDPQWAAAFDLGDGQTMYACMPTLDRLADFKRDPEAALRTYIGDLPGAPPIAASRLVEPVIGSLKMPTVHRRTTSPGLALAGDAAMASDPLWGVGCGWALQTGAWLADSVAPALRGEEPLAAGLRRYGRAHRKGLRMHSALIDSYASGRRMHAGERTMFSAAARDPKLGELSAAFGSRLIQPSALVSPAVLGRGALANVRHALGPGRRATSSPLLDAAR